MPCGFCSKSIEGLKKITQPPKKKSPGDSVFADLEISLNTADIFQCQLCGEYWVSEVKFAFGPPSEDNIFPDIVSEVVNTPRGYNLAGIEI